MDRRRFHAACAAAALGLAPATRAQPPFPSRPVTLLLPFPVGTTPDVVARLLIDSLAREWKQPVVVDNRGGAGGVIGTTLAAKAPPDGHTLLMGSVSTHAVNKSLYKSLPYDPVKDFDPVVLLTRAPNTVIVHSDLPVRSLAEFIAYAKARPGQLSFGSAGNGTSQHLAGEMFKTQAGIDLLHVPYKGGAAALTDLRAGQVQAMFEVLPSAMPHIRSGAVRALAVTSAERALTLPDVPAATETVPGYMVTTWHGFLAPAGTPRAVIQQINAAIARAITEPGTRQRVEALGFTPSTGTPEAFRDFMAEESKRWAAAVRASGARID